MKLETAIELIENYALYIDLRHTPELRSAINLGLEALYAIQLTRKSHVVLLKGETKE